MPAPTFAAKGGAGISLPSPRTRADPLERSRLPSGQGREGLLERNQPRGGPGLRESPSIERAAWILIGILLLLLLYRTWQGPDIFFHLHMGRQILKTGSLSPPDLVLAPPTGYVNIYWLFQVMVEISYRIGEVFGVSLLMVAAWVAIVALWARAASLLRSGGVGMILAIGGILILQNRFDPRPEVFSYLLLILMVDRLDRWARDGVELTWRRIASVGLLQLLWTNTHGFFALGPALVGIMAVSSMVQGRGRSSGWLKLLATVSVASFLSPHGVDGWRFVLDLWRFQGSMGWAIRETRPPTGDFLRIWTVQVFWACWAAVLLASVANAFRGERRIHLFAFAAAGLYLSASSVRNGPLLLLLGAPAMRSFLERALLEKKPGGKRRARLSSRVRAVAAPAAGLIACAISVWILSGTYHGTIEARTQLGLSLTPYTYPTKLADWLVPARFAGRIFANPADASYLQLRLPGARIYMDQRFMRAAETQTFLTALADPSAFRRLHAQYRFDAAVLLLGHSNDLIASLESDPEWTLAYGDLHRVLLLNARSDQAARLERRPVRYYDGEDLSLPPNGWPAIQWVILRIGEKNRAELGEALRQFGGAKAIPSPLIGYALQYALQVRDPALAREARQLHPKMIVLDRRDRGDVEALMRQAARLASAPP